MRWLLICSCFLLLLSFRSQAQGLIEGDVRDSLTQAPLAYASVFLANTTLGTTTDEAGRYRIANVPAGSYDVVVSYLGYRLTRQSVQVRNAAVTVPLRPAPMSNQLAGVVIRARRHRNRPEDYQRFVELFMGNTAFSRQCRIRNPSGVVVDYDAGANELTAETLDYLEVENQALGYRIRFFGLHFRINFKEQVQSYYAWPVFTELTTRSTKQRARWQANRLAAYQGSLPHFLRTVRNGIPAQEGFLAQRLRRVPNPRWVRADSTLRAQRQAHRGQPWQPDMALVQQYNQEPPQLAYLYTHPLPADSLRRLHEAAVLLRFRDLVQVTYQREKPDPAFVLPAARLGQPAVRPEQQASVLHLLRPQGIEIMPNGQLLDPLAVFTEGYWGFEKIGELLPVDYQPPTAGIGGATKKE